MRSDLSPQAGRGEPSQRTGPIPKIILTIARDKADHQGAQRHTVDSTYENPDLAGPGFADFSAIWRLAPLGDGADAGAHQADAVEVGLLAGVLFGAFAGLVPLVQQLDLLQLLEGLG